MEWMHVNQIPWSTLKPEEDGFYLYFPLAQEDQLYPRVDLVTIEKVYNGDLRADSDAWDTWYHIDDVDKGWWAKVDFKKE